MLVRRAGIVLAVNCTRRWRDDYRQALELLNDGVIGDLLFVQSRAQCGLIAQRQPSDYHAHHVHAWPSNIACGRGRS